MKVTYNNVDLNTTYKFGCVISFYNRKEFVSRTVDSINKSFLPDDLVFIIIDDGSTEDVEFDIKHPHIFIKKLKNYGISHSLVIGWDIVNLLKIDYFLNLDSDVIVSTNWLSSLFNIHQFHSKLNTKVIATGFNGINHRVKSTEKNYCIKHTIGGINLFFHTTLYSDIRKSLTSWEVVPNSIEDIIYNLDNYGSNPKIHPKYNGWDWGLMAIRKNDKTDLICTTPSVIQHIGTYGISSSENFSEIALDFKNRCVPKIIHQTWTDTNIPEHLKLMQKTVIDLHSDYEYKFWTDVDLEEFLLQNYPNTFLFYEKAFPYIIQKIDFIRLLLLYHFGGIYIDLDSVCIRNVDGILNYPSTLVSTKPHNAFSKKHYPMVLNNAFMASERGSDFIKQILIRIIEYENPIDYIEYCYLSVPYAKVLKSAGPLCITDAYKAYQNKSFIHIENNEYFYGVEYEKSLTPSQRMEYAFEVSGGLGNPHFIHMHESSWYGFKIEHPYDTPHKNKNYLSVGTDDIKQLAKTELENI
jgi:mannosyltransferase OCH1-like enzyme